jgi:hypothetical protein
VHRREANPKALSEELQSITVPGEGSAYGIFRKRLRERRRDPVPFDIPVEAMKQPVPAVPMFGYLDRPNGNTIYARGTDRIWLSGWAPAHGPRLR